MSAQAPPGIEPDAVGRWLDEHAGPLRAPVTFTPVGRGRSNLTYLVRDADGRTVVLRRPPTGSDATHDVGREHGVLARLASAGEPVPRPLAVCDDPAVTGAPFFVMEHVDGVVADSEASVTAGLDAAARAAAGPALARTLAGLHEVGLDDERRRRGGDYGARQLRRWSRQWEITQTRELPGVAAHAERLEATLPAQADVATVHGDYTVFNVILSPAGEVRAVLDWELSTVGDPVADVAWLLMWWPETPEQAPPGAAPVTLLPGFCSRADVLAAYADASGRDLSQLRWWTSLSYWKLAVIIEGIVRRNQDDPAVGGRDAAALAPGVERLLGLAEEALA